MRADANIGSHKARETITEFRVILPVRGIWVDLRRRSFGICCECKADRAVWRDFPGTICAGTFFRSRGRRNGPAIDPKQCFSLCECEPIPTTAATAQAEARVPLIVGGYTRMFETGHAVNYGIAFAHALDHSDYVQFEVRDYWAFSNPDQHNVVFRVVWLFGIVD